MANIFEQYGIKEVADVMIYELKEGNGVTEEVPYLYLDTLKVSTIEQTAEQSEARGGKGNSPLIIWDFGKEINVTLEDALYSPRSMAMAWGGQKLWESIETVDKTIAVKASKNSTFPEVKVYNPYESKDVTIPSQNIEWKDENGEVIAEKDGIQAGATYFASFKMQVKQNNSNQLVIKADDFPGTYKIVGDTYARNRDTGKDEFFQFIIHRAKMSSDNSLTLEAEGDPTVFNLNLRTLRPKDGKMIELIQYQMAPTQSVISPTSLED